MEGDEGIRELEEGINLVLSGWSALQLAIDNEWGGRDSAQRSKQLAIDILSLLTQSKPPIYIDDLENLLDDFMLSLNTEIGDGSIEEISEKILVMHEECLEGNFASVESLKRSNPPRVAASHIRQAGNDDDDDTSSGDDEDDNDSSEMAVDAPKPESKLSQMDMMVDEPTRSSGTAEADDGWTVVPSRRNKGSSKRS